MLFRIFVWVLFLVGGSVISIYYDLKFFPALFGNVIWHVVSFAIGFLLLKIVLRVSKTTGRTLAKYGRKGKLKRMETNVLVTQGVYKYMRHPMHLGLMLFPFSFAFLLGSPVFILFVAPAEIILILIMIKLIEEPGAVKKFNGEYIAYMKRTPGFCFRKECLKELFRDDV